MNDKLQPMDAGAKEGDRPVSSTNHRRVAHALSKLVGEARQLFPETPYEFSGADGRNTLLCVTFDLSALDPEEVAEFFELLTTVTGDSRVAEVIAVPQSELESPSLFVRLHSNPRTQDSRDSFDLDDIYVALTDDHEGYEIQDEETEVSRVFTSPGDFSFNTEDDGEYDRHESWCDGTQGCGMSGCAPKDGSL